MRCIINKECGHLFKIDGENTIYEEGEHTLDCFLLSHVDQRMAAKLKPAKAL